LVKEAEERQQHEKGSEDLGFQGRANAGRKVLRYEVPSPKGVSIKRILLKLDGLFRSHGVTLEMSDCGARNLPCPAQLKSGGLPVVALTQYKTTSD
jgi:hypothetical protein